jgi:hypothetical protein
VNREKTNSFVYKQEPGVPLPTLGIAEPRNFEIERQNFQKLTLEINLRKRGRGDSQGNGGRRPRHRLRLRLRRPKLRHVYGQRHRHGRPRQGHMHELVRPHHRKAPRLLQPRVRLGLRVRYPHGPELGLWVAERRRPGLQRPVDDGGRRRHGGVPRVRRRGEVELPHQLLNRRLRGDRGRRQPGRGRGRGPSALLLLPRHLPARPCRDRSKRPPARRSKRPHPIRDDARARSSRSGRGAEAPRRGAGRRPGLPGGGAAANGGFGGGLRGD